VGSTTLVVAASGNSEPGRAVADGTPPFIVIAVAQADNCWNDVIRHQACGRIGWLIELIRRLWSVTEVARNMSGKPKKIPRLSASAPPLNRSGGIAAPPRPIRAGYQGGGACFFAAASERQDEIRAAAAPLVHNDCMHCGHCHKPRGSPAAFSSDIVASNVADFRHLDSDQLVTFASGVAHQLIVQLDSVALKSRLAAIAGEDSDDDVFEKLACDLVTGAIDNLCGVETLLVERSRSDGHTVKLAVWLGSANSICSRHLHRDLLRPSVLLKRSGRLSS